MGIVIPFPVPPREGNDPHADGFRRDRLQAWLTVYRAAEAEIGLEPEPWPLGPLQVVR